MYQVDPVFLYETWIPAEKVNKRNGYRAVEVIDSITDKMRADMLADSYYY